MPGQESAAAATLCFARVQRKKNGTAWPSRRVLQEAR